MQETNVLIRMWLDRPESNLKELTSKDKDLLLSGCSLQHFRKGDWLFDEEDKPKGLICLLSGKVKVVKHGISGREQILRLVRPNDYIGYFALFSEQNWTKAARALEDSAICIFERSSFLKILKKYPELSVSFLKILSAELNDSQNRTVSLTQKHVRGRLAETLLLLKDIYGCEEDGRTIDVTLSREDIASLSNMTTSNAIRTLSTMAAEGSIKVKGRKISIMESSRLERISASG